MLIAASRTSCGIGLPSWAAFSKSATRLRMSASVSTSTASASSICSMRTVTYGSVCTNSAIRNRVRPSTSALAVPSGSLSSCMICATQPIS